MVIGSGLDCLGESTPPVSFLFFTLHLGSSKGDGEARTQGQDCPRLFDSWMHVVCGLFLYPPAKHALRGMLACFPNLLDGR